MPQSLQCPRCDGAVTVPDHAAGKRVKCPHCEDTFLAPGVASVSNDDDDWLKLDEEPLAPSAAPTPAPTPTPAPAPTPAPTPTPAPAPSPARAKPAAPATPLPAAPISKNPSSTPPKAGGGASSSGFTADEEALLAEFTDDLDDFTTQIEKPPAPHPSAATANPSGGVPGRDGSGGALADPPSAGAKRKPARQADVEEYAKEFRVKCNICGTALYAKANQSGRILKCVDCHSPITIPNPPKVKKKAAVNLEEASSFALKSSETTERRADPFQRSAEQLLEEASRVEETNTENQYDDTPNVLEWLANVFGAFKDLGVVVHWIGLSVLGSIPAVIALKVDSPILIMGLFPAGFFLGVLVVSCGFAILHAAANKEDSVSDWPSLDPMAWLGQLFVVLAAASVAAVPVWATCQIIIGPQLISVAITMFSIYALFPFVLLSMLDMNNAFIPFSAEVARSVNKCEEAWGGFYFSAGLVFLAVFMTFAIAVSMMSPATAAVVCIVTGVGAAFIYFSMLGRLAYAIGQAINAPPRRDEIDRTRQSDAV